MRHLLLVALLLLSACSARMVVEETPPPPPPPRELPPPVVLDEPTPMAIPAAPPAPPAPASMPSKQRFGVSGSRVAGAPPPASTSAHEIQLLSGEPTDTTADAGGRRRNPMIATTEQPVSTFSIDVDTGSYSRVRQMLRAGQLPHPIDVRVEEFLNYFDHGYRAPAAPTPPFAVTAELAPAPWNADRTLLLLGIKGFEVDTASLPPANLVFLVDTSGSMAVPDKLPLLLQGFTTLVDQLRPQDRVAIVAYAGSAGVVLPSTPGNQRAKILDALHQLQAGGGTAGAAGIELAYQIAEQNRIRGGINRVILATDGDFNIGLTGQALEELIVARREGGVALSTLGFGSLGYDERTAERLADIGNGAHAFIDDEVEAAKVLVRELGGTLLTIAKDVKLQLAFNPAEVSEYRLIGYENRRLANEDFANDRIDAGEIGAGHDVTALYELVLAEPAGSGPAATGDTRFAPGELAKLRIRYKPPTQDGSYAMETPLHRRMIAATPPPRLQFAAAIVAFAERLRGEQQGEYDYTAIADTLQKSTSPDPHGERAELADLVELAAALQESRQPAPR